MKEKKNFQKQKKEAKESRFKKKMSEIKRMIYLIYRNYRDGETQILAISSTATEFKADNSTKNIGPKNIIAI